MHKWGLVVWACAALLAQPVTADRFVVKLLLEKVEYDQTVYDSLAIGGYDLNLYYRMRYTEADDQGNTIGDSVELEVIPAIQTERDAPYVDQMDWETHYHELEPPFNVLVTAERYVPPNTFTFMGESTIPILEPEGYDLGAFGCRSNLGDNQTAPLLANGESVGTAHYRLRLFAIECHPGRHPTLEGYCVNATAGYIADGMSQTACPVGQYTDVDGQDTCRNCDTGFYQDSPAQTSCKQAQIGRYTNGIQEFVCAVGHFADSAGNTECTPCPPGMYQDEVASSECLPCAAGSYQEEYGRGSCDVCGECEDSYVRVNCTATSAGYCEDCNLLDQCPKESLSTGAVAGIAIGAVAFVLCIVGPVHYRRRKAALKEIRRKEEALKDMEREKQLMENMGTNVNPLLKENMKDTSELEAMNQAQQDKLEKMSDELRNMKKEKQQNASEDTVRVSIKSAKKKQFKAQNVVAYSPAMDK